MPRKDLDEISPLLPEKTPLRGTRKWLIITILTFNYLTISMGVSIRYGFLVDAFSSRGVPGKVYGLMEGSIFVGCLFAFFVNVPGRVMMQVRNSRCLMVGISAALSTLALINGMVYLIPSNETVVILSGSCRILQGIALYSLVIIGYDFLNANLAADFDLVVGIFNMGSYCGNGISQMFGCYLYDRFGYLTPFLFSSGLTLFSTIILILTLPKSKPYVISEIKQESDSLELDKHDSKLSIILIFPVIVIMLVSVNYGALQVTITPFLHLEFNKSISYGGLAATSVSLGMAAGSFLAGMLLQQKVLNSTTIMVVGSFFVCLGLLICFPQQNMAMYDLAPILVFPGAFLAGLGDPIMTIAALRTMLHIQERKTGQMKPVLITRVTSVWTICCYTFYFCGSLLAGIITDHFSFSDMGLILAVTCFVAVLISIGLRVSENMSQKEIMDSFD